MFEVDSNRAPGHCVSWSPSSLGHAGASSRDHRWTLGLMVISGIAVVRGLKKKSTTCDSDRPRSPQHDHRS